MTTGYDNWLQSGDPANEQFLCPMCGEDSAETEETEGSLPEDPVDGQTYSFMRKLECGCWYPSEWHYDQELGWL